MKQHLYHDETPPDREVCPECGSLLNVFGECMDRRFHEDPSESYRDDA